MAISSNSILSPRKRGKFSEKAAVEGPQQGLPLSFRLAQDQWSQTKLNEIHRFSRQIFDSNSLESLLQSIVQETTTILEVDISRVLLLQPDGYWNCEATFPDNFVPGKGSSQPEPELAQFIYQQVAQKKSPTILQRGSSFWITLEHHKPFTSRSSCLCLVPLTFGNETLGLLVLGLIGKNKPSTFEEEKSQLATFLAEQAAGSIYRIKMANRLQENQSETVLALSKTIQIRDDPTGGHSTRMTALAEQMAAACRCTVEEIQTVRRAGLLHDIGKIGIPDEILHRSGPLSDEEWTIVRHHPDIGAEIVLMVSNLAQVAELIRSHHERYDGKGYPRGLSGEQIPLGARILTVVDAYTAMTDGRAYRHAISHGEAIAEIKRCSGSHFDPWVVEMFLNLFH
jgi:putative nucleotidyltransferase with HDIG domain